MEDTHWGKEGVNTMPFKMYVPTRILFGCGVLNALHEQALPGKKALLVISNGRSAKTSGALDRVEKELELAGVEAILFDRIQPNPLKETVEEGGQVARKNGCDLIVALGGGSVLDASKAIATMATNEGDLWDYVVGGTGKGLPITNKPLPIVAITTTAGTGSEVDAYGVITNPKTKEKIGFGGIDELFPKLAIVDPELMKTVPPKFTAFQGFDALFHSVEGYLSNMANLMSDMYALTAIKNIGQYLARAVENGNDMEAREHVAFANTLSGVVMTLSSCMSQHSLEHALSAYHQELPHGAGLILLSKEYFSHFVNKHVRDERFVDMARALGRKDAQEPADFIKALACLQKACGVDDLKMSDYGIQPSEFDEMAKNARESMGRLFKSDPCPLSHEDCVAIYQKSYK